MSVRSIVLGLAGAAATLVSSEMALAAAGDDSANDIASRTAPGETTSQSCGSNGFIVVTFRAGATVVSTIESGTPCTPGGGGGGGSSSSLPAELQARLEQDLRNHALGNDVHGLLGQLVDEAGIPPVDESELPDNEHALLIAEYRRNIAYLRTEISSARSELLQAEAQLRDAEQRAIQAESDKVAAEHELRRAQEDAKDSPTGRALAAAEAKLADLRRRIANVEPLIYSHNHGTSAENTLAALRIRAQIAAREVAEARAAHAPMEAAVSAAEQKFSDAEDARVSASVDANTAEFNVESIKGDIATDRSEISDYQALIRALETQNQLAGPSGDAFETLRANGIEFWSRGGWFNADDTQSGRNQEVEQKNITLGVNGRLSERLLLGLAVSYIDGENTDQTGAGISSDTETFLFAPYLAYQLSEDLALDASGVYGITDVSITRATTATASYDATTLGGQIGLSLRHRLSNVISLTGRVGQSYVTTDSDGYTDTGGVTIASSDNEQAATSFSGRVNVSTDPDWRWHGALGVRYDTIDPGNGVDRFYGALSTGLEYNPGPYAVSVQASRSVFRSNYEATGLSLQVRVPF